MEITIEINPDDLSILKKLSSNNEIDTDDRRLLKNILDTKRCNVDALSILRRLMKIDDPTNRSFRLHEFLQRSKIELPSLPKQERSAELEARCERLRAQQANREYRDMTRNVDAQTAKEVR